MQPGSENKDLSNHPARPEQHYQKFLSLISNSTLAVPTPKSEPGRYPKRAFQPIAGLASEGGQGLLDLRDPKGLQKLLCDSLTVDQKLEDVPAEKRNGLESVDTYPGVSPRFPFDSAILALAPKPTAAERVLTQRWATFLDKSGSLAPENPPPESKAVADEKPAPTPAPPENPEPTFQSSARGRRLSRPAEPHPHAHVPERRPKKEPKKLTCKCKKSQCVRLYCVCFSSQGFCAADCTCKSCCNNEQNQELRKELIQDTLAKNPQAFTSKFKKINKDKKVLLHARGCNCRKTGCLKRYCECYKAKTGCTRLCRCTECKNDFIELTLEEVKANYEPVQRKRRRTQSQLRLWATKAAAATEKAPKK